MELIADNTDSQEKENTDNSGRKRRNPFKIEQLKEEKERRQKKRARLIVRNISFKASEETLRTHFEQWGTLEDVNILKRSDGKLVGCAFLQYSTINQATKAILKANNKEYLGRPVFVDWALGKDEFKGKQKDQVEPDEKKTKVECKEENENELDLNETIKEESENIDADVKEEDADVKEEVIKHETDDADSDDEEEDDNEDISEEDASDLDEDDKKDAKLKTKLETVKMAKHISNDVHEGCTVFIKNVPFEAEDNDLRKVCRKFGPVYYAIINREKISGHSKGTGFIKFKTKESADLCLQAGSDFKLMDQTLDPFPALSRDEVRQQSDEKSNGENAKDSRNLYLAREGLIMSGSKAADGVSASDMSRRHQLEQVKTQVLKNLNRFVSRNRLSIHNLPLNYDNDNLKQLAITYTGFKPHECRVMRENKITAEHPKGKSKGFGFMSFNTHKEALTALRKLNNNPKVFGNQHRPIVAFSIEDRTVHRIKEKRVQKSKMNNPTFKNKLTKHKEDNKQRVTNDKFTKLLKGPQSDDKEKLKKHIKKLEEQRIKANNPNVVKQKEEYENFVGTAAKPGTSIRMRSNKKIFEQATEHMKRVKQNKRKQKQNKIKQIHLAERMQDVRPKQGRKVERDDISHLVNKYKRMIDTKATLEGSSLTTIKSKIKKPKRTKWYQE